MGAVLAVAQESLAVKTALGFKSPPLFIERRPPFRLSCNAVRLSWTPLPPFSLKVSIAGLFIFVPKILKLEEKLSRYLYCRDCGVTGFIENFPFKSGKPKGDPNDAGDEKYCPNCMSSESLINLADLRFCSRCGERPVEEKGSCCIGCEEAYEAACVREKDFEPWD